MATVDHLDEGAHGAPLVLHGSGPWRTTTQGRYLAGFAAALATAGWSTAWSAFGISAPMTIDSSPVLPAGVGESDIIGRNARLLNPGVHRPPTLCLADPAALSQSEFDDVDLALYCEFTHTAPTGAQLDTLRRLRRQPVVMHRGDAAALAECGISAIHVPLSTHSAALAEAAAARREPMRDRLGVRPRDGVVGIRVANSDWRTGRSCLVEILTATRRLLEESPATIVFVDPWTAPEAAAPIDLDELIEELRFPAGAIRILDDNDRRLGLATADHASWFAPCDVVLIDPALELPALDALDAQACGVPVVVVDAPGASDMVAWGRAVHGEPRWDAMARQWAPGATADDLADAAAELMEEGRQQHHSDAARSWAIERDHSTVVERHWSALLNSWFGGAQ